jgi:Uri superfamily endonuclease
MATFEGKGTYTLIMHLGEGRKLKVGALGEIHFDEGFYAYTGSALGAGGFSRVARHREVSAGKNRTKQWHIDYLLPYAEIVETVTSPRLECSVAAGIDRELTRIARFGCSDCHCPSHLHYSSDCDAMIRVVRQAHRV